MKRLKNSGENNGDRNFDTLGVKKYIRKPVGGINLS